MQINKKDLADLAASSHLRVNGMDAPLGIDAVARCLSCKLPWSEPSASPFTVRVAVAATPEAAGWPFGLSLR